MVTNRLISWLARAALMARAFSRVPTSPGGWPWPITETYAGAWQTNVVEDPPATLLKFSPVYSCVTGIATDIAKLRMKLMRDVDGIWEEITEGSPFLAVLKKPNHFQNRIQFLENWATSKLLAGNTYVLKEYDNRGGAEMGIVRAMYVLDPMRVYPLVADDGSVFYQLKRDALSGIEQDQIAIPASEIIHDRMNCLWHPLVGVSPLYACALSGTMGSKIQNASAAFFANRSMPGGLLIAPGSISNETADRLKLGFETNFGGANQGRIAVLGDDLKYTPITMTAEASQLCEQLGLSIDDVARAFHYPRFKLGGPLPAYAGNVEALITAYYTDCLQGPIESLELCLDEGLALPKNVHVELDLDNLMRMDTAALYKTISDAVGGGWMAPNEGRFKANYKPVAGGRTPYLQQQYWSLEQLSKRDSAPPGIDPPKPAPAPEPKAEPEADPQKFADHLRKELSA